MGNFSRLTPALWAGKGEREERDGKEQGREKVDDGTATAARRRTGRHTLTLMQRQETVTK